MCWTAVSLMCCCFSTFIRLIPQLFFVHTTTTTKKKKIPNSLSLQPWRYVHTVELPKVLTADWKMCSLPRIVFVPSLYYRLKRITLTFGYMHKPPGVRVHTRYINSTKGTSSKKDAPSGIYTHHFRHTRRHRCVQAYDRTNFYSRPDIVLRSETGNLKSSK